MTTPTQVIPGSGRDARGWHFRTWLTRERMFCKQCKGERGEWVQIGGSRVMGDTPREQWHFAGSTYWSRVRQATKRHFAAEHPQITIR